MKKFSLKELAALLAARLIGNPDLLITGVNTLDEAFEEDASFLANSRYNDSMKKSRAGVICIDSQTIPIDGKNYLVCENPSVSFQKLVELFLPKSSSSGFIGVHPTATIHPSVQMGENVTIGPHVVIDRDVKIGDFSRIDANVTIYPEVQIGKNCTIYSNVTIRENCILKDRVILQPGAIIGSCGFGYIQDQKGNHIKLEQLGNVILEDDVEIGANTTIDRSRFKSTLIRKGTKIDNLCQIAHNVEVGEYNIFAAQTGIAGSAKTGKYVMLGGQVGVLGHVELEDKVMIATRSGVSKSLKTGMYRGAPAIPVADFNRQEVYIRKIEEYAQRIKKLEAILQDHIK